MAEKRVNRYVEGRQKNKTPESVLRRAMLSTLRERKHVFDLLASYDRGEWEPKAVSR